MNKLRVLAMLAALFQAALAAQPSIRFEAVRFEPATLIPSHDNSRGYSGRIDAAKGQAARLTMRNVTLLFCIQQAYSLKEYQISGPSWMKSAKYDIDATLPSGVAPDQVWQALRTLLAERLKLAVRRDQREMAIFQLTVAPKGPRLRPATGIAATAAFGFQPASHGGGALAGGSGSKDLRFNHASLEQFCGSLSASLNRPVIDATGIAGTFDFEFRYETHGDNSGRGASSALQRQLGLKLEPAKSTLDVLIVEGVVRKPSNP